MPSAAFLPCPVRIRQKKSGIKSYIIGKNRSSDPGCVLRTFIPMPRPKFVFSGTALLRGLPGYQPNLFFNLKISVYEFSTNRFSRKALLLVTAVFSASLLWAQATGISDVCSMRPVRRSSVRRSWSKGTTIATATNVDGTFNLKNTGRNVTLVVSYVGYEAQQVASKGAGSVTITLKPRPSAWRASKSSPWATVPETRIGRGPFHDPA